MAKWIELHEKNNDITFLVNARRLLSIAPLSDGGSELMMNEGSGIQVAEDYEVLRKIILDINE